MDIIIDDWEGFLATCTNEEYVTCHVIIDGEAYKNVAIRAKGNTSLSSVAAYGNDRYSFKVEFDHYQNGMTYHGLDKLSLNNLICDNTYMKDYFAYTLMNRMGVAAPLCSFVMMSVNGEPWGLYLAVEGVEDGFLQRNYGAQYGDLYKPDSLNFGGGRGNGEDFDMNDVMGDDGGSFGGRADNAQGEAASPGDGDDASSGASSGDSSGGSSSQPAEATQAPTATPAPSATPEPTAAPAAAADASAGDAAGDAASGDVESGDTASAGDAAAAMPEGFQMPDMGGFGGFGGFGGNTDVKLQYTDDDPESYPNIFGSAKTDVTAVDQARLIEALKKMNQGDASAVNADRVIRYMAVHNFLCNDDSYTGMMVHNYYLYEEDGKLEMIPWDYNLAYGGFSGGNATNTVNTTISRLVSSGSDSDRPMAGWITSSEEYMAQYYEVYREFIATCFDSGWFISEFDRVTALIDPYVQQDPTAFCSYEEFVTAAEILRTFCIKRAESVNRQLNGDNTQVNASELNLSLMGTMNNGGSPGGGDDRRTGKEKNNGDAVQAQPVQPAETTQPTAPEQSAVPAAPAPATAEPRPGAEGEASWDAESGWSREPGMGRTQSAGNTRMNGWISLAGCAVLLCAALLLVKFRRNGR